jgi:tagatose 1,6-diphosphate aldolase GatY/KbaY
MRTGVAAMLVRARADGSAVAGCSVYTLDQAAGVLDAAVAVRSPMIVQVHPGGVGDGLWALLAGLRVMADDAIVPVAVHLDHSADAAVLRRAVGCEVDGVMADGGTLDAEDNARLVADITVVAREAGIDVEAEMGRLAGTEDGWTVAEREARLTDPSQVTAFLAVSGATVLAVSIGNVHGATRTPPRLDLERLRSIADSTDVPLVLHGGSGLDDAQLRAAIDAGVCKVNINTELRAAYLGALVGGHREVELVTTLGHARDAVRQATAEVLVRLGCAGLLDRPAWQAT